MRSRKKSRSKAIGAILHYSHNYRIGKVKKNEPVYVPERVSKVDKKPIKTTAKRDLSDMYVYAKALEPVWKVAKHYKMINNAVMGVTGKPIAWDPARERMIEARNSRIAWDHVTKKMYDEL